MKKAVIYTLLLASFLPIISCQKKIRTTAELNKIFTQKEISDINLLVDYFEEELLQFNSNIDSAYVDFFTKEEDIANGKVKFHYEKLTKVFNTIDQNTFDEIWQFNPGTYASHPNNTVKFINIAYEKKFHQYIGELGKKNNTYKYLWERINASGSFPNFFTLQLLVFEVDTTSFQKVIINKDFSDFNKRVIIAMTTIKAIDEENRREKWKD